MTKTKKRKPKTKHVGIRWDQGYVDQLTKEAEADRRPLSDYLRKLIDTHPDRKK